MACIAVEKPPLATRNFSWAPAFPMDIDEHRHKTSRLITNFTRPPELYSETWKGYTNLEKQLSTRSNRG